MTTELQAIVESAKAAQEIAKTGGKAIDLASELGRFIAPFIGGPLEQATGLVADRLLYMRWERQQRFMERVYQKMKELKEIGPTKPIPLKFAVPLFQAASLEDDDYLQDLWANLLVRASLEKQNFELRRAYIDILERLSPLEAVVLETIYSLPADELQGKAIVTENLPTVVRVEREDGENSLSKPSDEITLALANLARMGCISLPTSWNGGEIFTTVHPAFLGRRLVEAVRI